MEEYKPSKLAQEIFKNIEERLEELSDKLEKGEYNPAYQIAFQIGILSDIDEILDNHHGG